MNTNYELPTDWNLLSLGLSPGTVAQVLNTVILDGGKKANGFNAYSRKNCVRINDELERRGIDYRISKKFTVFGSRLISRILFIPMFVEMQQWATALNLLSADYNSRGC